MNGADILVTILVVLLIAAAILLLLRNKNNRRSGCGGDCSGCFSCKDRYNDTDDTKR